jgi:hypothetical protein
MTGKWISSRNVWQCGECKRQTGIRVATIMEKSHLRRFAGSVHAFQRQEAKQ